jgi:ACR3 family arsenite transporter
MALLALLCFRWLFAPWVDPVMADEIIAGMILLGVAPCTAMVFVWSQLVRGDPNCTLVQVSVNDVVMVFAFAPIAALLLGVTDLTVPWQTLLLSVGLYVVLPLGAGWATRQALLARGPQALPGFLARIKPLGVLGLLATVALLFRAAGRHDGVAAAAHGADRAAAGGAELWRVRAGLGRRAAAGAAL